MIFYNYFLRDFSVTSFELIISVILCFWGLIFGFFSWHKFAHLGIPTPTGTIMIGVLPLLIGIQFFLNFLSYDINNIPQYTQHELM